MAIVVGNTSSGKITSAGLTLTISHTVVIGKNRLLLATVGYYNVSNTLTVSATYNGIAMTSMTSTIQNIGPSRQQVTFYLKNPPVGTANIVFTFGANSQAVGCGIDLSGVNLDDNLTFDTIVTASGSGSSNTVSPKSNTTILPDFVYASSFLNSESTTQSPSNGQTEIVYDNATISLAVGYKTAAGNITPIGWTFSSEIYRLHAFAVRAAGIAVLPVSEDTRLQSNTPTTNYNTNSSIIVGEHNSGSVTLRSLVKFDFSSIPADKILLSSIFKITPIGDYSSNARTIYMHRVLRSVVFSQATWNVFATSNNWGTAGCSNSTTDYDGAIVIGSMTQPASPTLNTELTMTLDEREIQKFYDGTYINNGVVLFVDTQNNDRIDYASIENATLEYRPRLVVQYSQPQSSGFFYFF